MTQSPSTREASVDAAPPTHSRAETGRAVALDPVGIVTPPTCACCGALAALTQVEQGRDERTIIVPYCAECLRHASRSRTKLLSISLGSWLLGLTAAAALPVALPWWSAPSVVLLALGAAAIPLARALSRRRDPGVGHQHSARFKAVWWLARGELYCTNRHWAAELAELNGAASRVASAREAPSAWLLGGLIATAAAAPAFHWLHHPAVRILNLNETSIVVRCDGRIVGQLEPTSAESAAAGVELRLPAGRRTLLAETPAGRVVERSVVNIQSGQRHLYAPGRHPYCFWLETTSYGRQAEREAHDRRLSGTDQFWVLPEGIDTWFARNPREDGRRVTSGGRLVALRQGRCSALPEEPDTPVPQR